MQYRADMRPAPLRRVLIFNYEVPCGGTDPPDFKQVIQVLLLSFLHPSCVCGTHLLQ